MKQDRRQPTPLAASGPYGVHIHAADETPRRRDWRLPQRRLECWLLVTSLDGDERIRVQGLDYDIPSGSTYLIPPGALHDLGSRRGNVPVWIHFDVLFDPRRDEPRHFGGAYDSELGDRVVHLQPDARQVWGLDLPIVIPDPLSAVFRNEIPDLVRTFRQHFTGRLLAEASLALLLARLVHHLWERNPSTQPDDDRDRLDRAEAVARQRLDNGFGLEAFAAAAGLGRSRFCQLYATLRGEAPGAFLQRERQARAAALLRSTALPLAHIATLVGYRDATVFIRAFRRAHGMTPGAWRTLAE